MAGTTNFKGITIQLDIDSSDFDSKLKKSNRAIDDFDRQLKKLDDALKLNPKNIEAIASRFDLIHEKTVQLENNVKQFESALKDLNAQGVERTDKRFIDVVSSLQKARSELAKYNEEMEKLENVDPNSIFLAYGSAGFEAKFSRLSGEVDKYNRKMKEVADAVDKANGAYDLMDTYQELSAERTKLLTHYISQLQDVMRDMRVKGIKPTSDEYVKYSVELANAVAQLHELDEAEEKAYKNRQRRNNMNNVSKSVMSSYLTESYDSLSKTFEKLNGVDMEEFVKRSGEIGDKWVSVGNNIKSVGNELNGLSRTAQTLLVGTGGLVTMAVNFEDAFANVKKTVDETTFISYEDLEEQIVSLSKVVPSTADEIATMVGLAGQLGVPTENVMEFTKAMIDLGNATNLTAEDAGTMIAQFFNVTHGDLRNVENFSSALVRLGNNSATTEADIMQLAFRLAGAGSNLGFTQQQILALSTALASAGLKAEAAGGAMSTVLQNIQKEVSGTPWGEANEGLKVWGELIGVTGEQFKKMWGEDTYGTFQKIIYGLGAFKDEGGDVTSKLAEMGIETIRTTDSMSRLISASENLAKYTSMANDAFAYGNDLQDEASKRYATTKSQLKILLNNVKALAINMGKELLPVINDFVKKAGDIIDNNKDWIKSNALLITKSLAFASALAPALKTMGTIVKWGGMLIKGIPQLVAGITSLSAPVALVAGLGTAFAYSFVKQSEALDMTGKNIAIMRDNLAKYREESALTYETIDKNEATRMGELDYYKRLADELATLVDENGKVKEGYQYRYDWILNEFVQAGIIQREDIAKTIGKENELRDAIYQTIEASKVSTIMTANEERKTQALKDHDTQVQWLSEHYQEYLEAQKTHNELLADGKQLEDEYATAWSNANAIMYEYQQMQEEFNKTNVLLENIKGMEEAYQSGKMSEVLRLYYEQEHELIYQKEEDIYQLLRDADQKRKELKESDDGTPLWQATMDNTEKEMVGLLYSVGFNLKEAKKIIDSYKGTFSSDVADIKAMFDFVRGTDTSSYKSNSVRRNSRYYQSGGFASGGITSNVTINVNNNGTTIGASEVRRWASIINDELGGSF